MSSQADSIFNNSKRCGEVNVSSNPNRRQCTEVTQRRGEIRMHQYGGEETGSLALRKRGAQSQMANVSSFGSHPSLRYRVTLSFSAQSLCGRRNPFPVRARRLWLLLYIQTYVFGDSRFYQVRVTRELVVSPPSRQCEVGQPTQLAYE